MATDGKVSESDYLKSLIISTVQELWEDKEALAKFLNVVRRSRGFGNLADTLEQSPVRPATIDERMDEICGAPKHPMASTIQQELSCTVWQVSEVQQEARGQAVKPRTWDRETERAVLLTPREIEVFFLLGVGSSNRTIATKLGITERTVKAHVARIMSKIGVESRLQAGLAAYAYQKASPGATASDAHQVRSMAEFGERAENTMDPVPVGALRSR
ncbi:DNA-binding CsgD family transcriptional regulator [Kitasatospora sp. MAA19]|uniref:response regulator transcription factor n=1 Tax=unclassified Kitasatospora TaxID=2633591 RepID=UPI0024765BB3|nr:LuxR C-terminal-related transcriptional regulator [Kitasatospora sp. MAA19]MDH6707221.1 DNA-binding CsgD family transcriptional regulator [Kitasatospora sp. MAA19]